MLLIAELVVAEINLALLLGMYATIEQTHRKKNKSV